MTVTLVLDPFCGGGTTMAVAERLHRRWIGMDISPDAIGKVTFRLQKWFGNQLAPIYMDGWPGDVAGAKRLADIDRYAFQVWATSFVGLQSTPKGSDRGIDGVGFFKDDKSGKHKKVVCQVKSGAVKSGDIRDLVGTMNREKADIGVFISLADVTRDMKTEAATAGLYSPGVMSIKAVAKLQILTIKELLNGHGIIYPSQILETTHDETKRHRKGELPEQSTLLLEH